METTTPTLASSTIEERSQKPMMKVMVAVDESDGSFYALKWVVENINAWTGGSAAQGEEGGFITLAHVQQPFQHTLYTGPGGADVPAAFYPPSTVVDSARKAQEENTARMLSRAMQMCSEKMIKAETLILDGDPKDAICQATEQMHIDLLVVGSRGLGRIKRAFLGSVSDYCAHHANCPVLIVKPPKEHGK